MRAWQLGLFSSWQNPSSCSPQFSTAQRGVNQESFARPYQTDLFNSFPVQSGSLWGNTKQPWKTTSFFLKTAIVKRKRAQNAGIYKHTCAAAFRKDLRTEVAAIFPLAEPSPSAPIRGIRPGRAHPGRPAPCRPVMLAQLFLPLAGLALLQRPPAAIVWCRRSPSESPPCKAVWGKGLFYLWGGRKK